MNARPDPAFAQLVEATRRSLSRGKGLRRKLDGGGRLHIDRPVPFLCLYRRPAEDTDPGTRRLLEGEAAYVIADGSEHFHEPLRSLSRAILEAQTEAFGATLLLELWASPNAPARPHGAPAFRLVAADRDAPTAVLEVLENALLNVQCSGRTATVDLSYRKAVAPPGLRPILTQREARALQCTHVGLEVDPLYREQPGGHIYPYKLNEIRHGLGQALKRAFHAFAHEHTRHRPAHYHELGRHSMSRAVWDIDRALAEIAEPFDLVLHVTPVNVPNAWREFESGGYSSSPELLYRPRPLDPGLAKRQLYSIQLERLEDPTLEAIFELKRDELDRQITLVSERNTRRFLLESQQLYPPVDEALLRTAGELADALPDPASDAPAEVSTVDEHELAAAAKTLLERYREVDETLSSQVFVRDDLPGVMVSRGDFLIGAPCRVRCDRVNALLAHEIETHVLTHHNGRRQRFRELAVGMAGYERLQEGLAVAAEYLVGGLDAARLRVIAARVFAVHALVSGADFVGVFRLLQERCGVSARTSFDVTVRVFRGGGFTKDAIYLAGLIDVIEHLASGRDLDSLYLGKIALEHLGPIDELRARRVLDAPALLPAFWQQDAVRKRMARLACIGSPVALANEAR